MNKENKKSISDYIFGFVMFGLIGLLIGILFYWVMEEKITLNSVDTHSDTLYVPK